MAFVEPPPELRLILVPAPDDLPSSSVEYQKELAGFSRALRAQGIETSLSCRAFDAVGGGGGLTGEFALIVTSAASFITGAATVAAAWLHARNDRKVRLKVSSSELDAEAQTLEGLETVIVRGLEIQRSMKPKVISEP